MLSVDLLKRKTRRPCPSLRRDNVGSGSRGNVSPRAATPLSRPFNRVSHRPRITRLARSSRVSRTFRSVGAFYINIPNEIFRVQTTVNLIPDGTVTRVTRDTR